MEKIYSLINFIKAYYPDSNIPMYLFSDEKCIFCMPEQNELTHPPFQYLRELFSGSDRITYCTTEYGIMFCSLRLNHGKTVTLFLVRSQLYLILIPTCNIYTKTTWYQTTAALISIPFFVRFHVYPCLLC